MEFTLTYRGLLRANRGPDDKHKLRKHFHLQLKNLWNQLPLSGYVDNMLQWPPEEGGVSIIEEHHGFRWAPLVSSRIHFVAGVEILLLRPEPPGTLVTKAGDLDNRVKTLLDGLKMPHEPTALPPGATSGQDETPFFCLLQDDALVTGLTIRTDRLLEPVTHPSEVLLLVKVRTGAVKSLIGTIGL